MPKVGRATIPPAPYGNPIPQSMLLPDTPEWRAVIRGLLLQGINDYFWDANTGDVQGAVQVMVRALTSWVYSTMDGTIYRVNPGNNCQIQSSTDDGISWALFFDATDCNGGGSPTDYSIYFRQLSTTPYLLEKTGSGAPSWETIFDARLYNPASDAIVKNPASIDNTINKASATHGLLVQNSAGDKIILSNSSDLLATIAHGQSGYKLRIKNDGFLRVGEQDYHTSVATDSSDEGILYVAQNPFSGDRRMYTNLLTHDSVQSYREFAFTDELTELVLGLLGGPIAFSDAGASAISVSESARIWSVSGIVPRPVVPQVDSAGVVQSLPGVYPLLGQSDSTIASGDTTSQLVRTFKSTLPPIIDTLSVGIEIDNTLTTPTATVERQAIGDDPNWKSQALVTVKLPDYGLASASQYPCRTFSQPIEGQTLEYAFDFVDGGRFVLPVPVEARTICSVSSRGLIALLRAYNNTPICDATGYGSPDSTGFREGQLLHAFYPVSHNGDSAYSPVYHAITEPIVATEQSFYVLETYKPEGTEPQGTLFVCVSLELPATELWHVQFLSGHGIGASGTPQLTAYAWQGVTADYVDDSYHGAAWPDLATESYRELGVSIDLTGKTGFGITRVVAHVQQHPNRSDSTGGPVVNDIFIDATSYAHRAVGNTYTDYLAYDLDTGDITVATPSLITINTEVRSTQGNPAQSDLVTVDVYGTGINPFV